MAVPSLNAALRRKQKAQAMLRNREVARRARLDLHVVGEPMPEWPDVRESDFWLVIDVPGRAE